jgi:glycosyltransferase involved in cell wall biosynthesis
MRIAYTTFVDNDLAALSRTLPYWARWVDEICVLDMGSTDGTEEYCADFGGGKIKYVRESVNWIPQRGFDVARNLSVSLAADVDWVISAGADAYIPLNCIDTFQSVLGNAIADCFAMPCVDVRFPLPLEDAAMPVERYLRKMDLPSVMQQCMTHRRVFRPGAVEYRGYIHEELWRCNTDIPTHLAPVLDVPYVHMAGVTRSQLRESRYAWMLLRAKQDPLLTKWTNSWWYDTYVPKNRERLLKQSELYDPVTDKLKIS